MGSVAALEGQTRSPRAGPRPCPVGWMMDQGQAGPDPTRADERQGLFSRSGGTRDPPWRIIFGMLRRNLERRAYWAARGSTFKADDKSATKPARSSSPCGSSLRPGGTPSRARGLDRVIARATARRAPGANTTHDCPASIHRRNAERSATGIPRIAHLVRADRHEPPTCSRSRGLLTRNSSATRDEEISNTFLLVYAALFPMSIRIGRAGVMSMDPVTPHRRRPTDSPPASRQTAFCCWLGSLLSARQSRLLATLPIVRMPAAASSARC